MYTYLTRFLTFLLPFVKKATIQILAEEIYRLAYDTDSASVKGNAVRRRPGVRRHIPRSYHEMVAATNNLTSKNMFFDAAITDKNGFHDVLLVAFDVSGPNAYQTHQWLMDNLPAVGEGGDKDEFYLDSWWVANDQRFDRSDCDSAIFVSKGQQEAARMELKSLGLSD